MLTLFTIFIAVACAGLAFWFYNKRQVKNLADQIEDKNAVINAFRSHVEETSTPVASVVDTTPVPSVQKQNHQQKTKNGGNKNRPNTQNGQKKSGNQKNQPSVEKNNRPNKSRKQKPQQ